MRPAEEIELNPARAIVDHIRRLIKCLARWFSRVQIQFRHVFATRGVGPPARGFITAHLFSHAPVSERGSTRLCPEGVAVSVIAVMMRVEYELHWLGGNRLDVRHERTGAARVIGVHNEQVILHLDHDVVAVAVLIEIALAEPNARDDLLDGFKLGVRAGSQESTQRKNCKRNSGKQSLHLIHPHERFFRIRAARTFLEPRLVRDRIELRPFRIRPARAFARCVGR